MVDKVEIWNRALDLLGERQTVLDPASTTGNANLCRRTYERVYRVIQRAYPWKCLMKKAALAADAEAPEFGPEFAYSFPPNFGRLLQVYEDEITVTLVPWKVIGRKIETSKEAPLRILYIQYSDNPGDWDELLQDAVTYRMAADMAESITQDPGKKSSNFALFSAVLDEAYSVDSFEQQPKNFNDGNWESARFAGGDTITDAYGDNR